VVRSITEILWSNAVAALMLLQHDAAIDAAARARRMPMKPGSVGDASKLVKCTMIKDEDEQ